MQNHTDSRTQRFSTPQKIWMFPLQDIAIKVVKCTKYDTKAKISSDFLFCSQYFKFFCNYMS